MDGWMDGWMDGGMNRWISGWRDGWMDMFYILKFLVIKFCSTQQLIYIVYLTKTHLFTHTHTHSHTGPYILIATQSGASCLFIRGQGRG